MAMVPVLRQLSPHYLIFSVYRTSPWRYPESALTAEESLSWRHCFAARKVNPGRTQVKRVPYVVFDTCTVISLMTVSLFPH